MPPRSPTPTSPLLCLLVHMTGDGSWIREHPLPTIPSTIDYQAGLTAEQQDAIRAAALPAVLAYRDGGCEPVELGDDVLAEMMGYLAGRPLEGRLRKMFFEDMQFAGGDNRAITWGDDIPADVKAASPVLVIGAGLSGILAGIRLTQAGLPFTIVEKNPAPGGTWYENHYPGARVDVGSHQYCYSFVPSDHWSEYYCQWPELRDYFARVLDDFGLRPHCRFDTAVKSLTWDEEKSVWRVKTERADASEGGEEVEEDYRFVVSAVGSLNLPKLPSIEGMDTFAGQSFHSARWPVDLDLHGKKFALVGAGASGFQIAPSIADDVEQLTIYQRTAQWMIRNPIYRQHVPPGDRWALRHLPFYARWFRFMMTYPGIATGTDVYRINPEYTDDDARWINESKAQRGEAMEQWIRSQLDGRDDLIEKSIPDYPSSGKRLLQDDGYWLQALCKPNVELVRTEIARIARRHRHHRRREAGGRRHLLRHRLPAQRLPRAHGGERARRRVTARAVGRRTDCVPRGVRAPHFPNLFCLYGPGTNLAHSSSLFFHSEFQMSHAMEAIRLVLTSGARSIEVDEKVHDEYAEWHQHEISQLVWAHPSIRHSHYKNPQGKVFTLSPWPIDQYWELTRTIDAADFQIA
ncbi:MAG: NAD(P)/FAD-dependent oxidoreductase [Acidimicrobiia bacterium]